MMMCLLCLIAMSGFSQYAGFKPVANLPTFKDNFKKQSENVLTINSDFSQEKSLVALTETITSTGKFYFKRSDKVRIDYVKPFTYSMIMNGDKLITRDEQKENRINVKSNKLFQQVNRIMIDCVNGTILDSKDFTTRVFENDDMFLLEMRPVSKVLQEFFETIVLKVDRKNYAADSIEMQEPSGDSTIISFTNRKLNTTLSDALFDL